MQIGSRWRVGDHPPASIPHVLAQEIAQVERDLSVHFTPDDEPSSWTLTWLERRPICTLAPHIALSIDTLGKVIRTPIAEHPEDTVLPSDNDDWLNS